MGSTGRSTRAGLMRSRQGSIGFADAAIRWLVEKNMLQSEGEPENPHDTGEGFYSKYGSVFRFTDAGREFLEEVRERRQS